MQVRPAARLRPRARQISSAYAYDAFMRRHSLLLPVLLLPFPACNAPLAPTEYAVLDASGLAGDWEVAWLELHD